MTPSTNENAIRLTVRFGCVPQFFTTIQGASTFQSLVSRVEETVDDRNYWQPFLGLNILEKSNKGGDSHGSIVDNDRGANVMKILVEFT